MTLDDTTITGTNSLLKSQSIYSIKIFPITLINTHFILILFSIITI